MEQSPLTSLPNLASVSFAGRTPSTSQNLSAPQVFMELQDVRFERILQEHLQRLRRNIARLCPRDLGIRPEDIEQEVHFRVWRILQSERIIEDVSSYLYRVAATATIDAMRRVAARREEPLRLAEEPGESPPIGAAPPVDSSASPERRAELEQLLSRVDGVLGRLPENRRQALGLHLQGFTTLEIGELLGWTEAKARNLVHRGLRSLRETLKAEGIEDEAE